MFQNSEVPVRGRCWPSRCSTCAVPASSRPPTSTASPSTPAPPTEGYLVHADIRTLAARTSRMSISRPPLQQLPKDDELVRRAFVAREGRKLIPVDYDQIEIAAHGALLQGPRTDRGVPRGRRHRPRLLHPDGPRHLRRALVPQGRQAARAGQVHDLRQAVRRGHPDHGRDRRCATGADGAGGPRDRRPLPRHQAVHQGRRAPGHPAPARGGPGLRDHALRPPAPVRRRQDLRAGQLPAPGPRRRDLQAWAGGARPGRVGGLHGAAGARRDPAGRARRPGRGGDDRGAQGDVATWPTTRCR